MSDDFDLAHDKLPDQPVTIGGDKSAAAWHPNHGPEVPHADLIARLRLHADSWLVRIGRDPLFIEAADALAAEKNRADFAEHQRKRAQMALADSERDAVIERVTELRDQVDSDRHDSDDALMLRGHRAIDADDHAALTRDEWAAYYTVIGRNGEATRILDHLAAIVSLRGAEYDLYTPPELDARKAN